VKLLKKVNLTKRESIGIFGLMLYTLIGFIVIFIISKTIIEFIAFYVILIILGIIFFKIIVSNQINIKEK
jgi:uncharacterized membrane protein YccC